MNDDASQGRFTNPTNYGGLERGGPFLPGGAGLVDIIGGHKRLGDAELGTWGLGIWEGDPMGQIYAIDNTVGTKAYAAFTQGTYTFNEQWALTLGIRWAQDDKKALEQRAFYFEDNGDTPIFLGALAGVWTGTCAAIYGTDCVSAGTTNQAAQNIVMGAAAPTFDPVNLILPICDGGAGGVGAAALTNPDCGTPLRLQGLPISVAAASEDKQSWDDITWRANLDWSPSDDHLFYLSATTGYRAGGYSLGVIDAATLNPDLTFDPPPSYDKETMIAYELGLERHAGGWPRSALLCSLLLRLRRLPGSDQRAEHDHGRYGQRRRELPEGGEHRIRDRRHLARYGRADPGRQLLLHPHRGEIGCLRLLLG